MTPDPKEIVTAGYDACGRHYNAARAHDPSPELQLLLDVLPTEARALEIGCGGGVPVTKTLADRAQVTAVDISPAQIAEARLRVPNARYIVGDIMAQRFDSVSFDAIVSFYTLFHLPRQEHRPLLERIARWLRPGGHVLATLPRSDHPGYTEEDFFGVTMFWSHFETAWYLSALDELGFDVLSSGILGHGYRNVPGVKSERHPVVLARKPPGANAPSCEGRASPRRSDG